MLLNTNPFSPCWTSLALNGLHRPQKIPKSHPSVIRPLLRQCCKGPCAHGQTGPKHVHDLHNTIGFECLNVHKPRPSWASQCLKRSCANLLRGLLLVGCRLHPAASTLDTVSSKRSSSQHPCCRFVRKGSKSKDCGDGHEMWILYPMARLWCSSFSLVSSSTSSKPPKNILPGFRRSTAAVSWRLLLQHLPMFHLSWSLKPWRIAHPV